MDPSSLVDEKVLVRWDHNNYTAYLLSFDASKDEGEVQFTGDFPNEFVSGGDIRQIKEQKLAKEPAVIVKPGSFNNIRFREYVTSTMRCKDMTPTTFYDKDMTSGILKGALFTLHAEQRMDERFVANCQELQRSLRTRDCLVWNRRKRIVRIGGKQIVFSWDFSRVHSISDPCGPSSPSESLTRADAAKALFAILLHDNKAGQKAAADEAKPAAEPLTIEILCASDCCFERERVFVVTTTSTFILSSDLRVMITCFQHRPGFGDWKDAESRQNAEQEKAKIQQQNAVREKAKKPKIQQRAVGMHGHRAGKSKSRRMAGTDIYSLTAVV